jgi:UTP--glucose-1-phosphate uridylyltransferase
VLVKTVKKAVIPAAGFGTRFLPITKSMPKEMLPLIDKPAIHYVVEEAINSGIDDILIITGRGKRAIEDYFDHSPELEFHLERKGKISQLADLKKISSLENIHYIRQKEPRGLGDAIGIAEKHIGDEPFAVLLGDDIVRDTPPCTQQLIDIYKKKAGSVIAVQPVPREKISSYGIIRGRYVDPDVLLLQDIVEKPDPANAPSDLGAIGRYIFTPDIFDYIKKTPVGIGNEVQLTDAIRLLCQDMQVFAYVYPGKRYDTGDKLGYLETIIDFALADPEIREKFIDYLKRIQQR